MKIIKIKLLLERTAVFQCRIVQHVVVPHRPSTCTQESLFRRRGLVGLFNTYEQSSLFCSQHNWLKKNVIKDFLSILAQSGHGLQPCCSNSGAECPFKRGCINRRQNKTAYNVHTTYGQTTVGGDV